MRDKNLHTQSIKLGKAQSYLHMMKKNSPDKFNEWQRLGNGDILTGYRKFNDNFQRDLDIIIQLYFELTAKKKWTKFIRDNKDKLSNSQKYYTTALIANLFLSHSSTPRMSFYIAVTELSNIIKEQK